MEVTDTVKKIKPLMNMQKTAEDREIVQIKVKETKDTETINKIDNMEGV